MIEIMSKCLNFKPFTVHVQTEFPASHRLSMRGKPNPNMNFETVNTSEPHLFIL